MGEDSLPMRCGHKLVADVALVAEDQVLLVKYRDTRKYDGQTGWFLPDDYLRRLEHPGEAAKRIVKEQTGLEASNLSLSFIESFEGNGAWHLIFHYRSETARAAPVAPVGNVGAAQWFPVDRLPPREDLAHGGWAADVLAGRAIT